ncbi:MULTISPECIES: pentapeptide repeat-containing protein [unclassified Tolypothrix]|uniref:pentapeptide repeat-containing protein n=1 Tax=unclassified Tolypothrix TaxID=2649714 RepID=UPI0005EABC2E|nr:MULTISPECIES: pentapeptide repeat-containing protein [unclassified Tolypothrix]BAY91685.1 pentapeptide repeat family protein [Microchaete diplosiphon NIES-3275]EKF05193.1 hypothetical protein FDUTEX481_01363 [Tolypothrix sp. PCC 7601]MBE9084309.1 pentapeptide repeat-containing protein [Tolypothrix sp. LEGE 11397]UYD25701.1 pentapeptide repeat-containing protein [Tolypothrix sp. PCC 7712]UYD32058.1 pentapeptide repeat-containing protein [Tolypothrix sp. PCC 7601]
MPSFNRDAPQYPLRQEWMNKRSCIVVCLCYLAGIITLPIILFLFWNRPEAQKQRFLQRETNQCQRCDLSNKDLSLKQFNNADFSQANLQNTILGATKLRNANFSHANLQQAVLRQANLENTIFDGANLSQADFHCGAGTCTYLDGTSFRNANLTGANFSYVGRTPVGDLGLPNVDFTGSDLSEANFEGANLKGSVMDQAKLCNTKMPDGKISKRNC